MKRRKIIIIILIIIIAICFNIKIKKQFSQNDLVFFKFYSEDNSLSENIKIKISKNKTNTKSVNLVAVNNQIKEKIAPGTQGEFAIQLVADEKIDYKIIFKSKNEKPANLFFYLENKQYNTLEELGKSIKGKLNKEEKKNIIIYWKWEYEIGNEENKKDTENGEKLKKYNFDIYAIGG